MKKSFSVLFIAAVIGASAWADSTTTAGAAAKTAAIQVKSLPASAAVAVVPMPKASSDVWVNGRVYHCPGSKFYGKTKKGVFMSEDAAKEAGAKVAHGRPCAPVAGK